MLARIEGRQDYAPPPGLSSARVLRGAQNSHCGAVDNLPPEGIDSPALALTWRRKTSCVESIRGRSRAGFVVAPLSRAIGSRIAGTAVQYLDPAAAGRRGRAHVAAAGAQPVRRRLGKRKR